MGVSESVRLLTFNQASLSKYPFILCPPLPLLQRPCPLHFPRVTCFSFRVPLKSSRLSVNHMLAGGNSQRIAVTTEKVAHSGIGFEFRRAALRKKAPLQMRRDNLFLTESPMKNRCSYFRISSLSKTSSPLSRRAVS